MALLQEQSDQEKVEKPAAQVDKAADPEGQEKPGQGGKGGAGICKGHSKLSLSSLSPGALSSPEDTQAVLQQQKTPDHLCRGQIS